MAESRATAPTSSTLTPLVRPLTHTPHSAPRRALWRSGGSAIRARRQCMTTVQRGWRTAFGNAIGQPGVGQLPEFPSEPLDVGNREPIDISAFEPVSAIELEESPDTTILQKPLVKRVKIRPGDTLEGKVGTSAPRKLDQIAQCNGLRSRYDFPEGITLEIPPDEILAGIDVSGAIRGRGLAGARYSAERQAAAPSSAHIGDEIAPLAELRATLRGIAGREDAGAVSAAFEQKA